MFKHEWLEVRESFQALFGCGFCVVCNLVHPANHSCNIHNHFKLDQILHVKFEKFKRGRSCQRGENILQHIFSSSIAYSDGCLYIFLIYCFYHLTYLCNNFYGLSAFKIVGYWSSVFIRRIFYKFLNETTKTKRLYFYVIRVTVEIYAGTSFAVSRMRSFMHVITFPDHPCIKKIHFIGLVLIFVVRRWPRK